MRIGTMDREITVQQATETNTNGSVSLTWATLATVWAHVAQSRGAETHESDQVAATRTITFRIRYRDDVTEKMRISYGSQTYDIAAVVELGRQEGLEITAVAAVP